MAWDFDGSNDYITIADATVLSFAASSPFAVSGWLRVSTNAGAPTFANSIISWGTPGATPSFNVFIYPTDHATLADRIEWRYVTGALTPASTLPGTDTAWQHYAFIRTAGGTRHIYRNGTSIGSAASTASCNVAEAWHWGVRNDVHTSTFFDGQLAEWCKLDRELSTREITALASGMSPIDLPGIFDATSWYLPMYSGAYVDVKDRIALTVNGSPIAAKHPPVRMPFARRRVIVLPAVGGGATPIAASDTGAIGMNELAILLGSVGIVDPTQIGLTSAAHILGSVEAADMVSIRANEAEQIVAIVSDADSVAVALSALMSAAVVLTPSDSVSLALSDAASILGRLDAHDAVPVSVIEAVNLLALLTESDGVDLDLAEAVSLLVSLDQSDLIGLSLTESASASILLFASVADSLGIGISEAAALAQAQAIAVADAMGLTLIEALTVSAGVLAAESVGVELSEVLDMLASVNVADAVPLDLTELLAVAGTLSVPDAIVLGLVDTATSAVVVELIDTLGITTAEAFSVLGALLIVDTIEINLAEIEALVMSGVVPEGDPITGFALPAILVGGDDRHAELVCG